MYLKYIFLFILLCGFFRADASIINGTIDATNHTAQICETVLCTVSSTSPVNFGYFTTASASNVTVADTELSGFIWGKSFGWAVLNCVNTTSGCVPTNGSFKVANDANGHLSGYAWGQTTGWINFGPFFNNDASPVTIDGSGQFGGYAWTQNHGWVKFDCGSGVDYCVTTDWRPRNTRPQCSDGTDNDSDGVIDSADSGCHTDQNPANGASYDPTDNLEFVNTNHGGCTVNCNPPTLCLDPTATNYNGSLPCTYPTPTMCNDINAINYGGVLPCKYPSQALCLDHTALNYNDPLPCKYPSPICTGPDCDSPPTFCSLHPTDSTCNPKQSFCTLHPSDPSCTTIIPPTKKTIDTVTKIVNTSGVKIIITAGALFGLLLSFSTALFANPLTFSEIFLIPIRLWSLLLAALGLKKRNRPWGIVYDSVTKQPLDPAYVILQDLQGNEVATSITDLDGRYGFLVPAGQYRMIAHKTNYEFPSRKLNGETSDELYSDLYESGVITVIEGGVITKNIPMDPLHFDWNEFAKKDKGLMKFYSKRDVLITHFTNILFVLGFTLTTVAVIVSPRIYNIVTFVVYILLFILRHTVLKPRPFGNLTYALTGNPLPFGVVRVFRSGSDQEVVHKVADKTGKYYCLVPNGRYYVKIENKNQDETYTLVYTSPMIEVKNGYINKKFKI